MRRKDYCIDEVKYTCRDGISYIQIRGWILPEKGKASDFIVKADNEIISVDNIVIDIIQRPDVCRAYGIDKTDIGFHVLIAFATNKIDNYRNISLILESKDDGRKSSILYFKSVRYIIDSVSSSLEITIDKISVFEKTVTVSGWGYASPLFDEIYEISNIEVWDKNQKIDASLKTFVREDLCLGLGEKAGNLKLGYKLSFDVEEDKKYTIIFRYKDDVFTKLITYKYACAEDRESRRRYLTYGQMLKSVDAKRIGDDINILFHNGPKYLAKKMYHRKSFGLECYDSWRKSNLTSRSELSNQRQVHFERNPKISIVVPTYRTPEKFLRQMIDSCLNQTYSNWELCIGDGSMDDSVIPVLEEYAAKDSRIIFKRLEENYGISGNTNGALDLATGEYISLLDHDDLLEPDALYEVVKAINSSDDVDVVYTDEDKVSLDLDYYFDPHFKTDFNLDLLRSGNYICHFFVVDRKIVNQVGGFRSEYDGSQDYDFILRCTSKAREIKHVSKCVYHWRCHPASTAMNPESKLYCYESGREAVKTSLLDNGVEGADAVNSKNYGYYEVTYPVNQELELPKVTVIYIPSLNYKHIDDRQNCLSDEQILKLCRYDNLEVINVSGGKLNQGERITSEMIHALEKSTGQYILFMVGNLTTASENWLKRMLGNCMRPEVGIVGCEVLDESNSVSSVGLVRGLRGLISPLYEYVPEAEHGYDLRLKAQCDVSAVELECLMISRDMYDDIGGIDSNLISSMYDVDMCMSVLKHGKKVVFTPYAKVWTSRQNMKTYKTWVDEDKIYLENKWKEFSDMTPDISYNCNFNMNSKDFSL